MASVPAERVLVVVNAVARGGPALLLDEVLQVSRALGFEAVVLEPQGSDRSIAEVADAVAGGGPWATVVAVGGDGSVRAVAEGLARGLRRLGTPGSAAEMPSTPAPPLFVVPGGTGNSVYRALWEDHPWSEVLAGALTGHARVRDLDLLRIAETGSIVLLGASAGLVAEAVRVSERLEGVEGRDRYQAAAITALEEHTPFPARVKVDGATLHEGPSTLVAVGGARHRAGTFQLLPLSVLDDGLLDVCVIRGVDAGAFVELAGVVTAGEHVGRPEVAYAQGRAVTIERTDGAPLTFEHDGDLWDRRDSALTIEVAATVPAFAPLRALAG
ncbi:MAG: diacylglycerol kinase family protein [Acidimicrobiia bacterium]|nr:diacylglycerol kinase family protein [Acidimicrobiia bacterium]